MLCTDILGAVSKLVGGGSGGAATGASDGTGTAALFYYPGGLTISSSGTVYVTDSNNLIRMISPTGIIITLSDTTRPRKSTLIIFFCCARCGDEICWWREC